MKIVSLNLQDGRGIVTVAVSDVLAADRLEDYMKDSKAALEAKPQGALVAFDAGILNTFGGGDRDWWLDYIRNLLSEAHAHYQEQVNAAPTPPAREVEPVYQVRSKIPFSKWTDVTLDECEKIRFSSEWECRKLYAHPADDGLRKAAEDELTAQLQDEMIKVAGLEATADALQKLLSVRDKRIAMMLQRGREIMNDHTERTKEAIQIRQCHDGLMRKAAGEVLRIIKESEVNHDARLEKAMNNLSAELNKDKSC